MFNNSQPGGILERAQNWMTPERAIAMQGLGQGISQLAMGQPVNMSGPLQMLAQRQKRADARRALDDSGIMGRFTPDQRAMLAQMEPGAAQKIIASALFAPEPKPVVVGDALVNPATGQPIYQAPQAPSERRIVKGADGFNYYQDTGERVLPNVTVQPEAPSAAESQIDRLVSTGLDRGTAIGIVDGRYVTSRDPITGQGVILDKATGQPIQSVPLEANEAIDTPAPSQAAPATQGPDLSFGQRFEGGDTSFGLGGAARGIANTAADTFGAPVPFPETQEAQADYGIMRESLLNTISQAYGRQPPSWVLQAIDSNLPKTGSLLIGSQKAESQFRALAREFESQKQQLEARLTRKMRPNVKGDVEAQIAGIDAALQQINAAISGISGNSGQTGETGSGIKWRVK